MKAVLGIILTLSLVTGCSEVKVNVGETLPDTEYPNGNKRTEYEVKDGLLQGKYVEYFESGSVMYEGQYEKGLRVGIWKEYAENGVLAEENEMSADMYNGTQKVYHPNGQLAVVGKAKEDVEEGEWWFFGLEGDTLKMENYKEGYLISKKEFQASRNAGYE